MNTTPFSARRKLCLMCHTHFAAVIFGVINQHIELPLLDKPIIAGNFDDARLILADILQIDITQIEKDWVKTEPGSYTIDYSAEFKNGFIQCTIGFDVFVNA
jgi:hypothetical protein